MKILCRGSKKKAAHAGKNWVSNVSVLPRHRARLDAAEEAVAHNHIRAGAQLLHKQIKVAEIITVIGMRLIPLTQGDL